ncbi:MAG: sulfide/dihydroorotate dehydrogenase-like FAD/NAD-binding protein [Candidatus Undinarchaeales archaeon]|jgi:ferredoxin--NADP+ reductase|nr:sulfide/dihydroorotate dehydrogenase-like FAD/NAD-binding protein [Candidatus Undinarchaeales archaeon]MDP7492173.1 sulfide/dihydroorotate dehydrogenase-like FAD/NAD-binding protein [Candidatus Undinarchaeales archaeon]
MSYRIVHKEEVVPNVHKLVIEDPRIARTAQPGQFVLLMPTEEGERTPITLSDWDVERGTITLYVLEFGITSMKLANMTEGDTVFSLAGPLGLPTRVEQFGTVLLGGGCYGIGGILPVARAMKEAGNHVVVIIEARSNFLLYNKEELGSVADELHVTTTDGSEGTKGHNWDLIGELLDEGRTFDRAYFVGCTRMLMRCAEATRPAGIPTGVALNAIMVDGTGMCGCCRVTVGGKTRFVCVDGPEMDGHEVDWEELFNRKCSYRGDEARAYQTHTCRVTGARVKGSDS